MTIAMPRRWGESRVAGDAAKEDLKRLESTISRSAEREGYLTEQGVRLVLKPFRVDQLEDAVRRACEQLNVPGVRAVWPIAPRPGPSSGEADDLVLDR